jgi:hypothetical protein
LALELTDEGKIRRKLARIYRETIEERTIIR